jgi:hypothetical protein
MVHPRCAHVFDHPRAGLVQVEEHVARTAAFGIWPEIDIAALVIAFAQTAHDGSARQILRGPQPSSRSWSVCDGVNQADQIELVRHSRQLSADGLAREKQSEVEHAAEDESGARCPAMIFQRTVTTPLTLCLSPGVHSKLLSIHT